MATTTTIFVDSRLRTATAGGSDSNFEVDLRESIHISSSSRLRVDSVTFTDSFLTTDSGTHLYFRDAGEGINVFSVPVGAYTGASLASAIQTATGRNTFYNSFTNSITHDLAAADQPWLSDAELANHTGGGFPSGASRSDPRSLNAVLGDGAIVGGQVIWSFVRMSPFNYVFLRSTRLRCVDHHGPSGSHDILAIIPLSQGTGSQVESSSPDGVFYRMKGNFSLQSFDLSLTDFKGTPVDLRGRPLALQITVLD